MSTDLDLTDAIKAGTLALMVCLYGDDLGGSATGDMWDDEHAMHREQVADVLRAAAPLIVADTRRKVAEEQADAAEQERTEIEAEVEKLSPSTRKFWDSNDAARVSAYGSVIRLIRLRRAAAIARGSGNGGTA